MARPRFSLTRYMCPSSASSSSFWSTSTSSWVLRQGEMTLLNHNPCNRATVQSKLLGMGWGDHHPMCWVVTSDPYTNQTKSIRSSHAPCLLHSHPPRRLPTLFSPPLPSDAILRVRVTRGSIIPPSLMAPDPPAPSRGPHLLHPHLPGVPRLQHLRRSWAHQQILTAPGRSMGANVGKRTKRTSKNR